MTHLMFQSLGSDFMVWCGDGRTLKRKDPCPGLVPPVPSPEFRCSLSLRDSVFREYFLVRLR